MVYFFDISFKKGQSCISMITLKTPFISIACFDDYVRTIEDYKLHQKITTVWTRGRRETALDILVLSMHLPCLSFKFSDFPVKLR